MGAVLVTPDPISLVPFGRGRGCVWTAPSDQEEEGGGGVLGIIARVVIIC